MKIPVIYGVFCLIVVGSFVYMKARGLELFDASAGETRGQTHSTGVYVGSHK